MSFGLINTGEKNKSHQVAQELQQALSRLEVAGNGLHAGVSVRASAASLLDNSSSSLPSFGSGGHD